MKTDKHLRSLAFLVAVGIAAFPLAGRAAAITGFQFNSFAGEGTDCDLDDRIGKSVGSTEHVVNIEDCKKFLTCQVETMWSVVRTLPVAADAEWAVKMSLPGGACTDTEFTVLGTTCMQTMTQNVVDIGSGTNLTFDFPFSDLVGGSCDTGKDLVTTIYVILRETVGGADSYSSSSIAVQVDLKAPVAPVLEEAAEGDSNLKVSWTDSENASETNLKYRVYYSPQAFDQASKGNATQGPAVTGLSYQVNGLTNETQYWYAVAAVDENDNEGPLSAVSTAMPVPVLDFFQAYRAENGHETGGFCFIATAAYGSSMADEVWTLRTFRDRFLLTSSPGRAFVAAYYALSPPLADFIAASETLRTVARAMLWPLVSLASLATALPAGWGWVVPAFLFLSVVAVMVATLAVVRARRRS